MQYELSKPFRLNFGWPPGCNDCGSRLCYDDIVAWSANTLTCKPCIVKRINSTVVGRRVNRGAK